MRGRKAIGAARACFPTAFSCSAEGVVGRGAGRESAICQALLELLNEASYESVSMDAVAARAKASKATIYRRWSNKEDLLIDALQRVFAVRHDLVPDTGSLRGDLVAVCRWQAEDPVMMVTNTAAIKGLLYASTAEPEVAASIRTTLEGAHLHVWQLLLDRAHTRGELPSAVPPTLVWDVAQAQFCARTGVQTGPLDAAYVEHVIDDILLPVILHAGQRTAASPT